MTSTSAASNYRAPKDFYSVSGSVLMAHYIYRHFITVTGDANGWVVYAEEDMGFYEYNHTS